VRTALSQRAFVHGRVKKEGSKSEITNDVHGEDGLPVAAATASILWQGPTWRRESRIREERRRTKGARIRSPTSRSVAAAFFRLSDSINDFRSARPVGSRRAMDEDLGGASRL